MCICIQAEESQGYWSVVARCEPGTLTAQRFCPYSCRRRWFVEAGRISPARSVRNHYRRWRTNTHDDGHEEDPQPLLE